MPSVFTPEHSALDLVFSDRTTYIIPPYQRPYSWQAIGKSDQNNQVNQMWDDLWGFFMANRNNGKEYFLGSMVVIDKGQRCFEVIDGQQRLTTLLLMFGAMRCFIQGCELEPADVASGWDPKKFRDRAEQNVERFLFNSTSLSITAEPKVRIQRDGGQNFDAVLKAVLDCKSVLPATEDRSQDIARRYLLNFRYFESKFRESFLVEDRMSRHHATELNEQMGGARARLRPDRRLHRTLRREPQSCPAALLRVQRPCRLLQVRTTPTPRKDQSRDLLRAHSRGLEPV